MREQSQHIRMRCSRRPSQLNVAVWRCGGMRGSAARPAAVLQLQLERTGSDGCIRRHCILVSLQCWTSVTEHKPFMAIQPRPDRRRHANRSGKRRSTLGASRFSTVHHTPSSHTSCSGAGWIHQKDRIPGLACVRQVAQVRHLSRLRGDATYVSRQACPASWTCRKLPIAAQQDRGPCTAGLVFVTNVQSARIHCTPPVTLSCLRPCPPFSPLRLSPARICIPHTHVCLFTAPSSSPSPPSSSPPTPRTRPHRPRACPAWPTRPGGRPPGGGPTRSGRRAWLLGDGLGRSGAALWGELTVTAEKGVRPAWRTAEREWGTAVRRRGSAWGRGVGALCCESGGVTNLQCRKW